MKSFTFCVLTFNHELYVVEHLESIKYLVENYAQEIECEIIINDDASTDDTTTRIDLWLLKNKGLFSKVKTIFNEQNLGTCASVINIVHAVNTEDCKITAADDIYSYINIFDFVSNNSGYSLLSGIPIRLVDTKISVNRFECFNYFASDVIYERKSFFDRITNLSIVNAPNIFYSTRHLKDASVLNFLEGYDVVEDWPLQIAIAKEDGGSALRSTSTPIVYYRRTNNSTYMVASSRFVKDQLKVLDFLIDECGKRHKSLTVYQRGK